MWRRGRHELGTAGVRFSDRDRGCPPPRRADGSPSARRGGERRRSAYKSQQLLFGLSQLPSSAWCSAPDVLIEEPSAHIEIAVVARRQGSLLVLGEALCERHHLLGGWGRSHGGRTLGLAHSRLLLGRTLGCARAANLGRRRGIMIARLPITTGCTARLFGPSTRAGRWRLAEVHGDTGQSSSRGQKGEPCSPW